MRFMKNHSLNIVSPKYFVDCWFNSEKTPYETTKKKLLQCINVNVSFHSNLPENVSLHVAKFGVPTSKFGIRIGKHFMDPQHAFTEVGVPTVVSVLGSEIHLASCQNSLLVVGEKLCTRSPFTPLFLRGAEVL